MIEACKHFLKEHLQELESVEGSFAFTDENIFFGPRPRGFLKDHQFAACCLVLYDKKKKDGSLVANIRDEECKYYNRIRKRFERKIMFRIILYAGSFDNQWGFDAFKGLIDQLEQKIAEHKVIADELNNAVKIDLQDSIRPWDLEESRQMLKRRPHKAIARVEFIGGIYVQKKVPIIWDVDIQPSLK